MSVSATRSSSSLPEYHLANDCCARTLRDCDDGDEGYQRCPALGVPDGRNTSFHDRIERIDTVSVRLLVSRQSTSNLVESSAQLLVQYVYA